MDAAPEFEAGSFGSDHTFTGRCADARALVDSSRAYAGARAVDEPDDDEGGGERGGLVYAVDLDTIRCKGLSSLLDEERASAISGDCLHRDNRVSP